MIVLLKDSVIFSVVRIVFIKRKDMMFCMFFLVVYFSYLESFRLIIVMMSGYLR